MAEPPQASWGGGGGKRLRQVLAELHAVTVRDTVSFRFPHDHVDPEGYVTDLTIAIAESAAHTLFDQLPRMGVFVIERERG